MVQPAGRPGQDIRDRTFEFACGVVSLCNAAYERGGIGRTIAPQLVNAATSAAAMLEEARGAESRRDFISKCSVALKEMREAHVRLRIHEQCQIGSLDQVTALRAEAGQLVAILIAIVRNAKLNQGR